MKMINNIYKPTEDKEIAEHIFKTHIDGLYYIADSFFPDNRGFFRGIALLPDLNTILGYDFIVRQMNHSRSITHVVRGFHAENWNKLITLSSGVAFCALADVRPNSTSFKTVETFMLGFGDGALSGSLYISKGIANSLCVMEGPVDYFYCFDQLYRDRDPKGDTAISLFDPDLNIQWPIERDAMIISERDINSVQLRQMYPEKFK